MIKLEKDVKLYIIISIIIMIILVIFLSIKTDHDVTTCINDGIDKNICEELRRL